MSIPVSDAFDLFRTLAQRSGLPVVGATSFGGSARGTVQVSHLNSELRMVWKDHDLLVLEITHGPVDSSQVFWLNLFTVRCQDGFFVGIKELEESILYGLELFTGKKVD